MDRLVTVHPWSKVTDRRQTWFTCCKWENTAFKKLMPVFGKWCPTKLILMALWI